MKCWAISDTHGMHSLLRPPKVDCLIYAGDSTNYRDLASNQIEFDHFFDWITGLDIPHKVVIAGNHDAWATKKRNKDRLSEAGIVYLEHSMVEINGYRFFGSPYTPNFGNWYFMKDRGKIAKYWDDVPYNVDVLITHGPPKGILDLSLRRDNTFEQCGDSALWRAVYNKEPKFHIFGHIHDCDSCRNFGTLSRDTGTTFMNVSSVEDGKFDKGPVHNGIIFDLGNIVPKTSKND